MKCTFSPYEGELPFIFVSYAHKNAEEVFPILERLNAEGFRIWYDEGIEWGTEWPQSIAEHLRRCSVCIAFHSNHSVNSPNCRQEINYALKQGKDILSIYLEDVILSDGMDMQLTSYQSTFPYQYDEMETFYKRLITTTMLASSREIQYNAQQRNNHNTEVYNEFTDALENVFRNTSSDSNLTAKIASIKAEKFIKEFEDNLKQMICVDENNVIYNLIPIDVNEGLHFSIPQRKNEVILAFRVVVKYEYKSLKKYYHIEEVDNEVHKIDNDLDQKVFFVDGYDEYSNQIIICSFKDDEVSVNMGILENESLRLSKKPVFMRMTKICKETDREKIISNAAYSYTELDLRNEYTQADISEVEHIEKVIDSPPIIIDPVTGKLIKREVYFDDNNKCLMAKCNFIVNKPYFSFMIKELNGNGIKMSYLEQAFAFRKGLYNFPQDMELALINFEKDGTPKSLFEIAMIFKNEYYLQDISLYSEYLRNAMDKGYSKAYIEYWIESYKQKNYANVKFPANAVKANDANVNTTDYANMIVLYALFCELGFCENVSGKDLFDLYYEAIKLKCKPGLLRVGVNPDCDVDARYDELKTRFNNSRLQNIALCKYIFGSMLFFCLDVPFEEQLGIELLEEASEAGNINATYTLQYIYEKDINNKDLSKSLLCLRKLTDFKSEYAVKLASWLIDGKGTVQSIENDLEAFNILQNASLRGNKTAINNLGWMYLKGRGCNSNFKVARELFETAANMGIGNSYKWLGEIYEQGLGVNVNIERALSYYRKGAGLGNGKCQERLVEIMKSSFIVDTEGI